MKPPILVLLALSLLLAGCQSTAQKAAAVCRTSCDDIVAQVGRLSRTYDEAAALAGRSAGAGEDFGRLLSQTDGYEDDLARLLKREIAVQEASPVQLTDGILRSASQSSDDFQRLQTWAQENERGIEFYGNLVCSYRDAYLDSISENRSGPTYEEIGLALTDRYGSSPPDPVELEVEWNRLVRSLQQNEINIWDSGITLYCMLSGLKP